MIAASCHYDVGRCSLLFLGYPAGVFRGIVASAGHEGGEMSRCTGPAVTGGCGNEME